jgi:hypothetical protein
MTRQVLAGTGPHRVVMPLLTCLGLVLLLADANAVRSTGENAVLEWNTHALAATITAGQGPLPQLRSMAIVHVAMNDAVQSIEGGIETYMDAGAPPAGASADAAAIAAAHFALSALFTAQDFDDELAASLAARGLAADDPGIAFGQSVAQAVLTLRATDQAAVAQFPYVAPGAGSPGVWEGNSPTSAALPGWGAVTPWVLESGAQFRPDGPPALDSGRYTRDYAEVKTYGAINSTARTTLQSDIARFWLATPSALSTPLARDVIVARDLDLSATARVLALLYMAGTDASIACWDAKYAYNFWRPTNAIRAGDNDGNDRTVGDPAWVPFLGTPQHPEYLSGHSTATSALQTTMALLFGDTPGIPLIGASPTNPGLTREWTTFSEAVDEVIDARIWGGFHYRTSDEVGARVGRQVAKFVVQHALRGLNEPAPPPLALQPPR